jgi:membrane fusion protein (multidrug efflux system)
MSLDPELDALPRRRRPRWTARRMAFLALIAAGGVTGAIYGHAWWRHLQSHVSTDDAYIAGRIAPVSARVSGHAAKVLVGRQPGRPNGDLLVSLDARLWVALAEAQRPRSRARRPAERHAQRPLTMILRGLTQVAVSAAAVGHMPRCHGD